MASKTQKGRLTIEFHAEKLDALSYCMKEKGVDLERAVTEYVGSLYEKNVPKIMKGFFESGNDSEMKKEQNHTEFYS